MMTPREDRTYGSVQKSRRSPPGGDSQNNGFFQQGGRPVLPPLSSAFPTTSPSSVSGHYSIPYVQSRSSTTKTDHTTSTYPQWPSSTTPVSAAQQHSSLCYEHYDPKCQQPQAYAACSSRTSSLIPPDPHGSCKLPPLSVPTAPTRDDRWQGSSYGPVGSQMHYNEIRSPTATYPPEFASCHSSYSYSPITDFRGHQYSMHHHHPMSVGTLPSERGLPPQPEVHGPSPYARGPITGRVLTEEPVPLVPTTEEPVIKKKRKRADAAQLKVLNEVYARTAFPSTEERAELAKKLDMSARSVQIWFQNKRQSTRQTSRQASNSVNASSQHQSFSMPSQADDPTHASYGGNTSPTSVPSQSYYGSPDSRPSGGKDARPSRPDDHKWPRPGGVY